MAVGEGSQTFPAFREYPAGLPATDDYFRHRLIC